MHHLQIEKNIKILKCLSVELNASEYNDWIVSNKADQVFERVNHIQDVIKDLDIKYEDFQNKNKGLAKEIEEKEQLKTTIEQEETFGYIMEFKNQLSAEDKRRLEEYSKDGNFYQLIGNLDIVKLIGNINSDGLYSAFGNESIEKLNNATTPEWMRNDIISKQKEYFEILGIYDNSVSYEEFFKTPKAKASMPSDEFLKKVKYLQKYHHDAAIKKNTIETSNYNEIIKDVNTLNLSESNNNFIAGNILNRTICINNVVSNQEQGPVSMALLFFPPEAALDSYKDIMLIHEPSHAVSLCFAQGQEQINGQKCGLENLETEERCYEQINENINQRIAQEVTDMMHADGVFLFNSPNQKTSGSTGYEHSNIVVDNFYTAFYEDIKKAFISNSKEKFIEKIGSDNFEQLSAVVNEFSQQPFYTILDSFANHEETFFTEKYFELVQKSANICDNMLANYEMIDQKVSTK